MISEFLTGNWDGIEWIDCTNGGIGMNVHHEYARIGYYLYQIDTSFITVSLPFVMRELKHCCCSFEKE